MLCGTGSFKHVDEDPEDLVGCTGGSPPRDKERRKHGGGKVNPYAERGLDRFSVVLSELETRRAKILRRVAGSDTAGLVLVRFVQSHGDWTPVVVKLPEQPPPSKKATVNTKKPTAAAATSTATPSRAPAPASPPPDPAGSPREREGASAKVVATSSSKTKVPAARKQASSSWGRRMRRPSCYWPSVIVLTLVSLAVFGRVFAICLASIWWYVLPTLGCGDDARRGVGPAAMRMMSMEKRKLVSPPRPHAKRGSVGGVHKVVSRSLKRG